MAVDKNLPILVVQDYRTMTRIIRNLLRQLGFENIEDARDGADALAKLRNQPFGLVISDWKMEPLTGLQLLKAMRGDDALSDIPFIIVSGESRPEHVAAALEAGVSHFIVKPFNAATLRAKLVNVLGEF